MKKSLICMTAVAAMIKAAMKYNDIDIMVSPWSPPPYMKTNGQMNEGASLRKSIMNYGRSFM
ncbi:MAG: hypothetical protein SOS24_01785 [Clostridia bacterium]|nr:hypothetical protein [Clostridia bacterium]